MARVRPSVRPGRPTGLKAELPLVSGLSDSKRDLPVAPYFFPCDNSVVSQHNQLGDRAWRFFWGPQEGPS